MAMKRRMMIKSLLGVGGACLLPVNLTRKIFRAGERLEKRWTCRQTVQSSAGRRIPVKPLDEASIRKPGKWGG